MKKILFFGLLAAGLTAEAQPVSPDSLRAEAKYAEVVQTDSLKTEPRHPRLSQVLRSGAATAGVTGVWYATYRLADSYFQYESQEDGHTLVGRGVKHLEPLGRGYTHLPMFGALFAYGIVARDAKAMKAAAICTGSYYLNGWVTTNLKKTFQRHRPNSGSTYNVWDGPNATTNNHSFPSSHTSTAFSTATVLATVYKDKPLVPVVAYSVASLVGVSRIYSNAHWASDVLAGAAVGYLSAKASVLTYNWLEKKSLQIMPQLGAGYAGMSLSFHPGAKAVPAVH